MKNQFSFFTIALISTLLLFSCNSSSEEEKVAVSTEVKTAVDTATTPVEATISSSDNALSKIASITNPGEAYDIYLNNSAEVERVAYAKWKQLMKQKIASITNPGEAYDIYLNNSAEVERVAYARYKALGGKK